MKFKLIYMWIVTSIIVLFTNILSGLVVVCATIVILMQDQKIQELKKKKNGGVKWKKIQNLFF